MAKRRADKQLTDRNWEDDDPVEEAGVFERASDDVLAKRTIRKAKRNLPQSDDGPARPNPFAGFSFNHNGGSASSVSSVSVNSNGTNSNTRTSDEYLLKVAQLNRDIQKFIDRLMIDSGPYLNLTPCFDDYMKHFQRLTTEEEERQRKNNNNSSSSTINTPSSGSLTTTTGGFGTLTAAAATGNVTSPKTSTDTEIPKATFNFGVKTTTTTAAKTSNDFNSKGTGFTFGAPTGSSSNLSNSANVNDASSPVKFTFGAPPAGASSQTPSSSAVTPVKSVFGSSSSVFGGTAASTGNTDPPVTFKFGSTASTAASGDKTEKTTTSTQPLFSFNAKTGFGFGSTGSESNSTVPASTAAQETNEEDEDAPPKVDVAPVEDEGSLYTKKVKLFYKKPEPDEKEPYADKGVGYLHIKKLDNGGYQLLVRAQSTLGNVLLNIRLGKDMPVRSVGKNNVAILCVPNPRLDPKAKDDKPDPPTMFLIRVKTSEDATELREKLIEYKDSV